MSFGINMLYKPSSNRAGIKPIGGRGHVLVPIDPRSCTHIIIVRVKDIDNNLRFSHIYDYNNYAATA